MSLYEQIQFLEDRVARLESIATGLIRQRRIDIEEMKQMAQKQEEFKSALERLDKKVDDYTTDIGQQIKDAVAAALAAHEEEDEATFEDATKRLEAIGDKLVQFKPSQM